tara:strand:+ start:425 stop:1243 length:819 start_codon:yes stop_codon:yes gene_type:complete
MDKSRKDITLQEGVLRLYAITWKLYEDQYADFDDFLENAQWKSVLDSLHSTALLMFVEKPAGQLIKDLNDDLRNVVLRAHVDIVDMHRKSGKRAPTLTDTVLEILGEETPPFEADPPVEEPDETSLNDRYDALLAPLEPQPVPNTPEERLEDPLQSDKKTQLISLELDKESIDACIAYMTTEEQDVPPGHTLYEIERQEGQTPLIKGATIAIGVVTAEGGPYVDVALLDANLMIVSEGRPLRDTKFLEGNQRVQLSHAGTDYEIELVSVERG